MERYDPPEPRRSRRIHEARAARNAGQDQDGPRILRGRRQRRRNQQAQQQAIHNPQSNASFLGLPHEVRRKIYQYALNFEDSVANVSIPEDWQSPEYWDGRNNHPRGQIRSGLNLFSVNKMIHEELVDEFTGPWGWLDMNVTAIRLPSFHEMRDNIPYYNRTNDGETNVLRRHLPLAVRWSASTIILHRGLFKVLLKYNDQVGEFLNESPDVQALFPTACKPCGRFVIWFETFFEVNVVLGHIIPAFNDWIPAMRTLPVGESRSFVFPSAPGSGIFYPFNDMDEREWRIPLKRCIERQHFNLTFEYPRSQRTMQHIIFNDPPGVVTFKTMWRKDSYCGHWRNGRK